MADLNNHSSSHVSSGSGPATNNLQQNKMLNSLPLAKSSDGRFETGKPITFEFLRNKESAGYYGKLYSQDIEPKGMYMISKEVSGPVSDMWNVGTVKFDNPLVIRFVDTHQWKKDLVDAFHVKGKSLSNKLLKLGYDAIVTVDDKGNTWEIVNLKPVQGIINYEIHS